MDLPTCPSCGQSVLDDDVADCPFCGAPMRGGKPGQAAPKAPRQPTPTKPTPSEPGSTRPAASKPSAAQAKKKAKSEEDDEVISFDGAALRQAIPLSRKPARGRMMRVVCPMCDTPGFASEDAAGKDVKCVNPECLVPIFKAPEIKKKEPEPKEKPEEPSGGLSGVAKVAIALGAVVVVGGAGWFFFLREGSSTGKPAAPQPTAQTLGQSTTEPGAGEQPEAAETTGPQAKPEAKEEPKEPATAPVPQIDPAEVTASALAKMVEAARRRENNRSKPFCRQLTAEAFACAGNIEEAKHQIEQLRLVGKDVPYYQIGAWVAIAWNQLQFGDEEGARQSIEAAWALKDRIPTFGQTGADAAIDLAVPLVVMDRLDDARNLLTEHLGQSTRGELSALLRMVYGDRSYDVDEAVSRLPVAPWKHPEWVSVAIELAAHRGTQKALAWAQAAPDLATQADTLAVWGAAVVRKAVGEGQPVPITDIRSAVESLPPSFQAGVLAQVAYAAARADAQEPAEQLIRFTQEALSRVSTPKEFVIPGMKELYEAEFPDPSPLRTAAAASTELSRTHALLGKTEQAVKDIQRALTFLRASAPSVVAAALRDGEFKRRGRSAIEASLRRLLELETREQARLAANRYRKKCHDLLESAKQRWQLQLRLLARAADWLPAEALWNEIQSRAQAKDVQQREPYFTTWLPRRLALRSEGAGKAELSKAIRQAVADKAPKDARGMLQSETTELLAKNQFAEAAKRIEEHGKTNRRDHPWVMRWVLQLTCRLVKEDKAPQAFQFVSSLENPLWREAAFQIAAALCVRRGLAGYAWQFAQESRLSATEEVALLHGLVVALAEKPE